MSCRSSAGNSLVTSIARATSGLADVQVLHLFHRVLREGAAQNYPNPSQADFNQWLTATRNQIENATSVSEAQRRRWLAQIEQIGAATIPIPNGSTFYAWQQIEAQASRSRAALTNTYTRFGQTLGLDSTQLKDRVQQLEREFEALSAGERNSYRFPTPTLLIQALNLNSELAAYPSASEQSYPNSESETATANLPQDKRTEYVLHQLHQQLLRSNATDGNRASAGAGAAAATAGPPPSPTIAPRSSTSGEAQSSLIVATSSNNIALNDDDNSLSATVDPIPSSARPVPPARPSRPRRVRARIVELLQPSQPQPQPSTQGVEAEEIGLGLIQPGQSSGQEQASAQETTNNISSSSTSPAPRLSGSEGQRIYEQWVAEAHAIRQAGRGPEYETENVLGAAATTFGVELEFKGADTDVVARKLYDLGLTAHPYMVEYHHPRNPPCPTCEAAGPNKWKVERDGSVTEVRDGHNWGGEVVAPVLSDTPQHWEQIKQVSEAIKELGGYADENTGQHVHVGTASYGESGNSYLKLAVLVAENEDLLYRASAPDVEQHRGLLRTDHGPYHYTRPIAARVQPLVATPEPSLHHLLGALGVYEASEHRNVPQAHYLGLNVQHVTANNIHNNRVEFRVFNGTIDPVQIQTNVRLSAALVHAANKEATQAAASPLTQVAGDNSGSRPGTSLPAVPASLAAQSRAGQGPGQAGAGAWRELGWHRQNSKPTEDSEQFRTLIDKLGLSTSGAKAILDTFVRSKWQTARRTAVSASQGQSRRRRSS